jgi:RHS repeat-associated protein
LTTPGGEVVTTTYNPQALPATLTGATSYVTDASYDALGRVDLLQLGTTPTVMQIDDVYYPWSERNGQGRLKQIRTGTTGAPTDTQDLQYGYDPAGNVVTIVDGKVSGGAQTQSFGYDPLDRLVSASAAGGDAGQGQYDESYTYNEIGNLTSKGGVTYTYPAAGSARPHAVTGASNGGSFSYDYNGNMTSRRLQTGGPTYTQTWDCDNRLVTVTVTISGSEQTTTTFTYDGNGALVKKESGGETTVYVGSYYEKNVTTGQVTRYYFFNGQRIAMRQGDVLYYIAGDHLGTTSVVLDASGNKVAESRHYPYGVERWSSGTLPTDYRFTGQRFEVGLGIYVMGVRWYDPALGRWLSADTLVPEPGNPQSLNRYSWVLGNPLNFVDPSGHKEEGACTPGDENVVCTTQEAMYKDYEPLWTYCADNPGDPVCQPTATPAEAAFWFIVGVSGAEVMVGAIEGAGVLLVQSGADWVAYRVGKATVEEFLESQMTGRPFDWVNVGLDAGTEVLDEAYTAWKVGDPINKPTKAGSYPSWETAKQRYWKNAAASAEPGEYSEANLVRMKSGRAPLHEDLQVSVELHHINGRTGSDPHNPNNLMEVWPWQHAAIDPQRFYNGPRPK